MELILFTLISLIVIVTMLASRINDNSFPFPFDRKKTVFTAAEKNFLNLAEKALGSDYRIINRVKLADILTIRGGVSNKAGQKAISTANNKYLDFVICDRDSMTLLGTLDLVDTQGKGYKVKKDWFVSGALEAASIPHIRIKVKSNYTVEEIKTCILQKITKPSIVPVEPKMKGVTVPASMIKARSRNQGVVSSTMAKDMAKDAASSVPQLPKSAPKLPPHIARQTSKLAQRQVGSQPVAALPH